MPERWSCANGHQWDGKSPETGESTAVLTACPVCGSTDLRSAGDADAQTIGLEGGPVTGNPADTVQLPAEGAEGSAASSPSQPTLEFSGPVALRAVPEPPDVDSRAGTREAPDRKPRGNPPPYRDRPAAAPPPGVKRDGAKPPAPGLAGENYEVLGELGRGGMGVVYVARQKKLNRLIALKMILAGAHAAEKDLARFRLEAEAVAALRHPNIVQIYEVGELDGRPYFSLEYVEGGSLAGKMDGTPLPPEEAARMGEALARAMHYAHLRGIVHRDLKPANVLLTDDGTPKITDFGLAKLTEQDSGQTGSGTILGTPSYMAPEQAGGLSAEVGPVADVYALGAMLYEMLTGRPPLRGASALDTLTLVQNVEPVPPRRLQPKVPRDLETVCLKCLQKEPRKRYGSAGELADDLARYLRREPIRARPVGAAERAWKWARRRPAIAALLAALAVVLTGAFMGMLALWLTAEEQRDAAETAQADAEAKGLLAARSALAAEKAGELAKAKAKAALAAEKEARASYARSRRGHYATAMGLAQTALRGGRIDSALKLLDGLRPGPGEDDLRGFEWHYLRRLCEAGRQAVQRHTSLVTHVAFSPDGSLLASASLDQTVKVWQWNASGENWRELSTLRGHARPARGLAFSPDSARVATAGADGAVLVWDARSGKQLLALPGHRYGAECVAFAPSGNLLASGGRDAVVAVWDLGTGKLRHALAGHEYAVTAVAFSPDGACLASAGEDRTVRTWDALSGSEGPTFRGHGGWVTCVAFSPDGARLASGSRDHTVRVWDLALKRPPRVLEGQAGPVQGVDFSPDGRFVASASAAGAVRVWDLEGEQGVRTLRGHPGLVRTVAFSPDGQKLASVAFDTRSADPTPVFARHGGAVQAVAFGPAGTLAASGGAWLDPKGGVRGEVQLWDAATRKAVRVRREHAGPVRCVALSRDGKLLASGGEDRDVLLTPTGASTETLRLGGHTRWVTGVAFTPDGKLLASSSEDGTVRLWDTATGKCLATLPVHDGPVRGVAISPGGKTLATAGADGQVKLWDLAGRKELRPLKGRHAYAACCVAFSPDGTVLASGGEDQKVLLWPLDRPDDAPAELTGHGDTVTAVAFDPEGRRLATASEDRTVKVWDAASRLEILTLAGHTAGVTGAAFGPRGRVLVSVSWDQTARVWDGTPTE